jgi:alpha-tubulin suppressor-like RCC1 family protein
MRTEAVPAFGGLVVASRVAHTAMATRGMTKMDAHTIAARLAGRLTRAVAAALALTSLLLPMVASPAAPSISVGYDHVLALKAAGTISSWGRDHSGQLGIGRQIAVTRPAAVPGLPRMVAVSAGFTHTVALDDSGNVWAWGMNDSGSVGDGSQTDRSAPVRIGLAGVTRISAGHSHTLALKADGTVWAWGFGEGGQIGDGSTLSRSSPTAVSGLTDVVAIAAGVSHSVALKRDGTVWVWGLNYYEPVADAPCCLRAAPVQVPGLTDVVAISAGAAYTVALRRDGTVWSWGDGYFGNIGDGAYETRSAPVQAVGLSNVISISASNYNPLSSILENSYGPHTLALKADGTVWGWGSNAFGQLGKGVGFNPSRPVQIAGIANAASIASGGQHSLATLRDGTVLSLGDNRYGQLGTGDTTSRSVASTVAGGVVLASIAAGSWFSAGVSASGALYVWGFNAGLIVGDGSSLNHTVPSPVAGLSGATVISAGSQTSLALDATGAVYAWGNNLAGEVGDGTTTFRPAPTLISGVTGSALSAGVTTVVAGNASSFAVNKDGTVLAWGWGAYGQLGNNTRDSRLLPAPVPDLSDVACLAAGGLHVVACRRDGTVVAWGYNSSGQLGDGTKIDRLAPTAVDISDVVAVAAGAEHSLALKRDGTVWAWGRNDALQIDDFRFDRSTPVPVRGIDDVIAIAAGAKFNLALKRDGSVWSWGDNASGQLGNGTAIATLGVGRVSDLTDIVAISANASSAHALAMDSRGVVWSWGENAFGQTGNGTLAIHARPVVVMREEGAGGIATSDWFLDLRPGTPKAIPAGKIPAFLMVATGSLNSDRMTLKADLKFKAQDVGKPIYFFAYVRASKLGLAKAGEDSCVPVQSSPSGSTGSADPSQWQSSGTNVSNAASQGMTFVDNAATQGRQGNSYCAGAGATPKEALDNGRCAGTVPGATPCLPPETGNAALPVSYQALWWNPVESGWGVNLAHQGDNLFATWFTYDVDRSGMWLVMSSSTHNADGSYSGALARTTGPAFNAVPWSPGAVSAVEVGSATFTFRDASHGTFQYSVNGVTQTKAIERLDFSAPIPTCTVGGAAGASPNYSDLWWASPAASENGWGLNIVHQGDVIFSTWYTYGADRKGMWLSMSDGRKNANGSYSGTLQRTTGPAYSASPWNPAQVSRTTVGTATLAFSDANTATFQYTVDGVSQAKTITRLVFKAPQTVCR